MIAPDVWTVQDHRSLLGDPERPYRPKKCPTCGGDKLHVHDYRERHPLGLVLVVVLLVARFVCVNPQCRATWRVLPAFLARHLWWQWQDIERNTIGAKPVVVPTEAIGGIESELGTTVAPAAVTPIATSSSRARSPSKRSTQRWRQRLAASARQLVELMAKRGGSVLEAVARAVGQASDRMQLVRVYVEALQVETGRQLASVAAVVDELERGVRLM